MNKPKIPKGLKSLEDCIGKTVVAVDDHWGYAFAFDDGSYLNLAASAGYDGEGLLHIIDIEPGETEVLLQLGIFTEEQHQAVCDARKAEWEASAEARDRRQYEKLKARFEPTEEQ